jgi:hypothetical protein
LLRYPSIPGAYAGDQEVTLVVDGGAERDRTVDPLLAKQVLSQLSYSPYDRQLSDVLLIHYTNVQESGGPG